jgi:glyoxylate utilization-related uncharacterized protein
MNLSQHRGAQGLSEHTAPFDALAQMLEGEMEISIDGKPLIVEAGHLLLMPANHPHALKAIVKSKMLLTMIRSHGGLELQHIQSPRALGRHLPGSFFDSDLRPIVLSLSVI